MAAVAYRRPVPRKLSAAAQFGLPCSNGNQRRSLSGTSRPVAARATKAVLATEPSRRTTIDG